MTHNHNKRGVDYTCYHCPEDISWALREMVWVTLIDQDDDLGMTQFLVVRQPNGMQKAFPDDPNHFAFTMTFLPGMALINGEKVDLGDDLPGYMMLANNCAMAPHPQTVTTEAGPREEWFPGGIA